MTATATRKSSRRGGVTMDKSRLQKALQSLSGAISHRPASPILANVLLADGKLTATNLEVKVSLDIGFECEPMVVPHAKLLAITKSTGEEEISLSIEGSCCIVECGSGSRKGKWKIPVESASEYPNWDPSGLRPVCHVPSAQLQRAIHRVIDATDNESSRYALGGVCIDVNRDNNTATFVATDGRRLHLATVELPDDQDQDNNSVVVPEKAMLLVQKTVGGDGHALIEANDREAVFTSEGVQVTARLIEGRFPRWREVFPADPESKSVATVVDIESLKQAMRSAAIVTTEQSKGVAMSLCSSGILCRASSSESGEANVKIDVVSGGEERRAKLDPKFVLDWLHGFDAADDQHVSVHVIDQERACVLKNGDDYTAIIMPLSQD